MSNKGSMMHQASLLRASTGLMFFSSLVFASGIQRAQIYTYFLSAGTLLSFPPSALLLGALMEVTMGLIGFAFGASAMLGYRVPSLVAWIVFGTLEIFAWFVTMIAIFMFLVGFFSLTNHHQKNQVCVSHLCVHSTRDGCCCDCYA